MDKYSKNKENIALFPGMAGLTRDIIERMKAEGGELLSLDIMLTQRCNFKCIYCYAEGTPEKKNELSLAEACQLVDEALKMGVRVINMQGGEPLMWNPPDWKGRPGEAFFHIVEYVRKLYKKNKKPVDIVSFTDVAPITPDKAKKLISLGIALCCKLDSMDACVQDRLLGIKGGSAKMMKGYDNLIKAGYGKKGKPKLSTNTVVTALNYDGVKDVFRWSRKHGFFPFVIPVHVHGRAKTSSDIMLCGKNSSGSTLNPYHMKALFESLAEIDRKEFGIFWEANTPWVENKACSRHLGGIHVRADGIVVPCSEAPDFWALGDIRKQSLREIVFSKKVKTFRNIYSNLHEGSNCSPQNCPISAQKKCYGCRTRAYDESAFSEDGGYDVSKLDPQAFFSGDPACWRTVEFQKQEKPVKQSRGKKE